MLRPACRFGSDRTRIVGQSGNPPLVYYSAKAVDTSLLALSVTSETVTPAGNEKRPLWCTIVPIPEGQNGNPGWVGQ
jgi:hypothetical protein